MAQQDNGGSAFPGHVMDRYYKYVSVKNENGCTEWTGGKSSKGYGVFALSHVKQVRAHRFSVWVRDGSEPDGFVMHLCNNPSCVNPDHLVVGTHTENMQYMAKTKRATRQERHHKAKLLDLEVLAIHFMHKSNGNSTRDIAKMFGMSQPTISAIVKGDLWPDIKSEADAMLEARK